MVRRNFTDPNQVSCADTNIFYSYHLYTYSDYLPILVAIVLAYMLEGLVQNLMKTASLMRNFSVIIVFVAFLIVSVLTMFILILLLLDQLTLFVKSLPEILIKVESHFKYV